MTQDPYDRFVAEVEAEVAAGFSEPRFQELFKKMFAQWQQDPSRTGSRIFAQALVEVRGQLEGGMKNPEFGTRFEARLNELLHEDHRSHLQ